MIVALSHSVPRQPGRLSSSSASTLQYEDHRSTPCEVYWLDCSIVPPKPTDGISVTHTVQSQIQDMCCVQSEDKQLLITTQATYGIHAYNANTDTLEWSLMGKLPSTRQEISAETITTDGVGGLFICDTNNARILVCSVEGTYLGSVLREENQNLTKAWKICWCSEISSLIVAHRKEKRYHVSMIRDTSQKVQAHETTQAEPTEQMSTRIRDPVEMVAFTITPVTEVAEALPLTVTPVESNLTQSAIEPISTQEVVEIMPLEISPIELNLGPLITEPACEEVSDADLSFSEESRTPYNNQTKQATADQTATEAESDETEKTAKGSDVESSADESMDISLEDISDSDLPIAKDDSEDGLDDSTVEDAVQTDNYKGIIIITN